MGGSSVPGIEPIPRTLTMHVKGVWVDRVENLVYAEDYPPFRTDEKRNRGGTDKAPAPMDYFLGALVSCTSVMSRIHARGVGLKYSAWEAEADGVLNPRALGGLEESYPGFQQVTLRVTITTEQPREKVEELAAVVRRHCPINLMLRAAKVPFEETWIARQP